MLSVKREADSSSEGGGKKMKGAAGGMARGGGAQDDKTDPIPRSLPTQSITLNFVQRTWEEIGPGELKYLPLSVGPRYMFDTAMKAQYKKFEGLWSTMEIHHPKARLSNLIMLQDDLINQGGTPMETTAFTQACYMMTFKPRGQSQYFALGNVACSNTTTPITYNLSEVTCEPPITQLITLKGYEEFEKLGVIPAKLDINAGPIPKKNLDPNIEDPYIHPQTEPGYGRVVSGNMQVGPESFLKPFKTLTYAKNMDSIKLHKYGDVVEIPITTNLDGVKLLRHENNNLFQENMVINGQTYNTEFYYPGINRPYLSRSDNMNLIKPTEHIKGMSHLNHTFITMPPIKKANHALLKQR